MQKDWVVLNADKHPITTSKKVSEVFGQLHNNIVAKIEMLDSSSEFFRQNFNKAKGFNRNWKLNPAYEMTRDGFVFLSIGFTGKIAFEFSLQYIEAFDEMVTRQKNRNGNTQEYRGTLGDIGDAHWIFS